jgi:pyruvate dehydrogenase E1 component beta subunit
MGAEFLRGFDVSEMTYRDALRESLRECLATDDKVFLVGEDVGRYGGAFGISRDLLRQFGESKVMDAPLSELGFVGAAIGAALSGLHPIVEIMTVNFSLLALDQIINNAATLRYMSGGQCAVPLVIRMTTGAGRQLAAQHSHSWEGWIAHVPGIKVVAPATIDDARYMLKAALDDSNPVLIFENMSLFGMTGYISTGVSEVNLSGATVVRQGSDLSLITYGGSLPKALKASEILSKEGVHPEVIDLRCLRPLDDQTVMASVRKCGRALVIDEDWPTVSLGSEIMARIMEQAFYDLDAPVRRINSVDIPMPYAKHLEEAALPSVDTILKAAHEVLGHHD